MNKHQLRYNTIDAGVSAFFINTINLSEQQIPTPILKNQKEICFVLDANATAYFGKNPSGEFTISKLSVR